MTLIFIILKRNYTISIITVSVNFKNKFYNRSLKLPIDIHPVENACNDAPEEDLREDDIKQNAYSLRVPDSNEYVLLNPVYLQKIGPDI